MANPLLFQPFTIRGLEVRNRLWVSPMCQYAVMDEDGVPCDWHLQHIGALARGGAGLVFVEASAVTPEGRISPRDLGLWNDEQIPAHARLVDIAHSHGAKIGVQIAHAGRKASTYPWWPGFPSTSIPEEEGGWITVAPSAAAYNELATPRALETAELSGIVDAFAAAADRAAQAGYDAVELHAAHGYLLHEFLSPFSNLREDDYGGNLEGRAKLLREVVREIRARVPAMPLSVRISATEWVGDNYEGGFNVEEAEQVVAWLAEDGADLIDVSSGANTPARIPVGPSYQVPFAAQLSRGPLPVGTVGFILSAQQAEGILVTGQADIVLLGRPLLGNPHLPISWAHELRASNANELIPPAYHRGHF